MTQEAKDGINATIEKAEESIHRITEELGKMKTAAELLDESGKRSQMLQDAVENLVEEIGSLVKLSGRVVEALNASEVRAVITEMGTVLSRRLDELRTELLETSKSDTERVGAELQTVLIQQMESVGKEIAAGNESATGRVGAELRGALTQRLDILEKKITLGTETATEQVGAELRGALVQRIDSLENEITIVTVSTTEHVRTEVVTASDKSTTDFNKVFERLDVLDSKIAEVRDLAEKSSKRKGLLL
ncbi:MAG: hypothetical protein F4047_07415 [Caldilineaceae bacterium SB0670_bin_27]|uniref:Uncharacterized protein n=1 Tax=Caldilineaceae bacterium SB0664_bin_27 TaxID=2605260 RepID=A0A6B0YTD2_9CHLR|nr:hypothetical protein [Caldilineaceae bacterium SB0664_bin_27]MYJ77965.1 hypothetical protein [Caldilineaceae bacterium SB0670_bin_27]